MTEQELDSLFDAARADPPEVPQALADRVLADAQTHAASQTAPWRVWIAALGGAWGLGGLITATCVGFWIGVAPPEGMPDLAGLVLGAETLGESDSETGLFGWDIEEG